MPTPAPSSLTPCLSVALPAAPADHHLLLFKPTWIEVDRARSFLAAAGLDHRIHVHHAAALNLVRPTRKAG